MSEQSTTASYLSPRHARLQKTMSAMLREVDLVFSDLKTDMNNVGNEQYERKCYGCQKSLEKTDTIANAMGQRFHVGCFKCHNCSTQLSDKTFVRYGNDPYCEPCHQSVFSSKCEACGKTIVDKILTAKEKAYHADCFVCAVCGKPPGSEFVDHEGRVYCAADYISKFSPNCTVCKGSIGTEAFLVFADNKIHQRCFACTTCREVFNGKPAFNFGGQPYCERHFHEKNNSMCRGCSKPVVGQCVKALNGLYHPACFVCTTCKTTLTAQFYAVNDQPYCEQHAAEVLSK